jgi:hypothetical protein
MEEVAVGAPCFQRRLFENNIFYANLVLEARGSHFMKLVSFLRQQTETWGAVRGDEVVELGKVLGGSLTDFIASKFADREKIVAAHKPVEIEQFGRLRLLNCAFRLKNCQIT